MTLGEFQSDQETIDAVLRNLEIIGETAGRIPNEIAKRYPEYFGRTCALCEIRHP